MIRSTFTPSCAMMSATLGHLPGFFLTITQKEATLIFCSDNEGANSDLAVQENTTTGNFPPGSRPC